MEISARSGSAQGQERSAVALVRTVYDAFVRGDIPLVMTLFDPGVELVQSTEVPWGGVYHGLDGVKAFIGKLTAHVESRVTVERCIDAGTNVIAIGRTAGRVRATGRAFDVPIAHVWEVREGLLTRVMFCIDNPTMLAALGAGSE